MGHYFHTLSKEKRIDFYEKQIAFWKSVIAKYPQPKNRTQHKYMMRLLDREMQKEWNQDR